MSRIDIKPRIVEDLEKYELYRDKKKTTYTVGSIKKDRFIMASEKNVDDIIGVYKLFDGEHTIDDIVKIYKDNNKEIDVLKLFNIAEQAGLIENTNKKEVILNEFQKYGFSIMDINIGDKLNCIFRRCAHIVSIPFCVFLVAIILIATVLLPKFGISIVKLNIYNLFDSVFISIIISTVITTICVLLHEMAHAIVAAHYRLIPQKVSISIYLFTPIIYITIPGIYTLPRKQRILVHAAGIIMNAFIFSVSVMFLPFSFGTLREIMLLIAFNNLGLIVMNLVPFLPLDGYFILTNILKIPNLRRISGKKIISIIRGEKRKLVEYIIYNIISVLFVSLVSISIVIQIIYNFSLGVNSRGGVLGGIIEIKGYLLIIIIMCISKILSFKGSKNYGKDN